MPPNTRGVIAKDCSLRKPLGLKRTDTNRIRADRFPQRPMHAVAPAARYFPQPPSVYTDAKDATFRLQWGSKSIPTSHFQIMKRLLPGWRRTRGVVLMDRITAYADNVKYLFCQKHLIAAR